MKIVINPRYQYLKEFIGSLPETFPTEGIPIYEGRNTVKIFRVNGEDLVVKSFKIPHFINKIVYAHFRSSKAMRSYENAMMLQKNGIGTPSPVGFLSIVKNGLFERSYYVSLKSRFSRELREIADLPRTGDTLSIVGDFARFTADLHNKKILHSDYTPGNILFDKTGDHFEFELVDTNRMVAGKSIDMKTGCKNVDSLCLDEDLYSLLAREYASRRGFDLDECERLMLKYRDPDA